MVTILRARDPADHSTIARKKVLCPGAFADAFAAVDPMLDDLSDYMMLNVMCYIWAHGKYKPV